MQYGFYKKAYAVRIYYGLKSIYQEVKKIKASNMIAWSIMMKVHWSLKIVLRLY